MSAYVAEAVGTMILVLMGNGVVANTVLTRSKAQNAGWMAIATGWGLAVAVAVYSVGRLSGGHINPAVTVALASIGAFPWEEVPGFVLSQIFGGIAGATLVWLAFLPHWAATEDPGLKLAAFSTAPAIRSAWANFLCEVIGTALLLFGVLAIADNAQVLDAGGARLSVVFSTGLQPLLIGVLVWGIGLSLGGPTGYAINPARDLGPRIAHALLPVAGKRGSDWGYAWIPVVAPLIGGASGAFAYHAFAR